MPSAEPSVGLYRCTFTACQVHVALKLQPELDPPNTTTRIHQGSSGGTLDISCKYGTICTKSRFNVYNEYNIQFNSKDRKTSLGTPECAIPKLQRPPV